MAQLHDHLSARFSTIMASFTHDWGFVIVRTAYADDEATDAAQWSTALAKLQEYAQRPENNARRHRGTFVLPVVADPNLKGASYDEVRTAFNAWIKHYQGEHELQSDVRRDCCLVVDGPALTSLLQAPNWEDRPKQPALEPWVIAVDAEDPATIPYNGGGPYLGWTRACALSVGDLFGDIEARSLEQMSPIRVYDGQLPLYNGIPGGGELIDPEGGVEGRYKFPQGTPRGIERGKAMLADIRQALGNHAVPQIADVDGRITKRGPSP